MTFGEKFTKLLEEKQVMRIDIAAACGVTDSTVSQWVHDRKEPRSRYLPFIARRLGITVDELLAGVYDEEEEAKACTGRSTSLK